MIFPFLTQAVVDQCIATNNLSCYYTGAGIAGCAVCDPACCRVYPYWIVFACHTRKYRAYIGFPREIDEAAHTLFRLEEYRDILQRIGDNDRTIVPYRVDPDHAVLLRHFYIFAIILGYYSLTILGVFYNWQLFICELDTAVYEVPPQARSCPFSPRPPWHRATWCRL